MEFGKWKLCRNYTHTYLFKDTEQDTPQNQYVKRTLSPPSLLFPLKTEVAPWVRVKSIFPIYTRVIVKFTEQVDVDHIPSMAVMKDGGCNSLLPPIIFNAFSCHWNKIFHHQGHIGNWCTTTFLCKTKPHKNILRIPSISQYPLVTM